MPKPLMLGAKKVVGGVALSVKCSKCGGPIIGSDEYGFFCKNRCNEAENKKAYKQLKGLMSDFMKAEGIV